MQNQDKIKESEIPCLRCGTCCSKYQPRLILSEAQTLANKLGTSWESFLAEYTDPRWPGKTSFLIRHNQNGCIFLEHSPDNKQHLCHIHAFKPQCCRDWASDLHKPECQSGLKNHWDLTMDSSGSISGAADKLDEFKRFLQVLNTPADK